MQVLVHLTKKDIARANLLLMAKSPGTLRGLTLITAVVAIAVYIAQRPETAVDWAVFALAALVGGFIGFICSCTINLLWILSNSTEIAGVTGEHVFTISDLGFREKTKQNDSLQEWGGLLKPIRSSQLILVRINAYLFHVLPRRAFDSDAHYEAFWGELSRRCGNAA